MKIYLMVFQKGNTLWKTRKGTVSWNKGKKGLQHHSSETRLKMSQTRKGRKKPPRSEKHRLKLSEAMKGRPSWNKGKKFTHLTGEYQASWKGDNVGYGALHDYIKRRLPIPELCEICNKRTPRELANISHAYNPTTYTRDLKNWRWLCYMCHRLSDGRLDKLQKKAIQAFFGRHHTEESRRKMSEAHKRRELNKKAKQRGGELL